MDNATKEHGSPAMLADHCWQLTFWHRSFKFNSNKSPTWCNNFSVYYPDVCLQLNMFRAFSRPSSGAQWLQRQPLVLFSYRGDSRAVFVVGLITNTAWLSPRHEGKTKGCHCSQWAPDDGGGTPETCWAVNKRQDNGLENCCIRLVIYFKTIRSCILLTFVAQA